MTHPTTYIALLRGINVGGHSRLAMADLRGVLDRLGHQDVRTYVQSGNAVFTSGRSDPEAIGTELTRRLAADLDVSPTVMVRTADAYALALDADQYARERLWLGDRVVYLHLPGGMGRSRLATDLARRLGDGEMTVRNWRTVTRLLEMAGRT